MKKLIIIIAIIASFITGCARIETGTVGVRVGWDKQIVMNELQPGSFNQTMIGDVLHLPVRDIKVALDDLKPQTSDNSTLADFDITLIYNINPGSVAELYASKSKGFHYIDEKSGDIYLMYDYMTTVARTAAYKAARNYESLKVADNRDKIQTEIVQLVREALKEEKLEQAINITQVQVRNVTPNQQIIQSATEVITAQNNLKAKAIEVDIAKKEAERIALLNNNKGAVEYMGAMANMKIAEAIAAGKVNTIIIPSNLTMLGDVSKK